MKSITAWLFVALPLTAMAASLIENRDPAGNSSHMYMNNSLQNEVDHGNSVQQQKSQIKSSGAGPITAGYATQEYEIHVNG